MQAAGAPDPGDLRRRRMLRRGAALLGRIGVGVAVTLAAAGAAAALAALAVPILGVPAGAALVAALQTPLAAAVGKKALDGVEDAAKAVIDHWLGATPPGWADIERLDATENDLDKLSTRQLPDFAQIGEYCASFKMADIELEEAGVGDLGELAQTAPESYASIQRLLVPGADLSLRWAASLYRSWELGLRGGWDQVTEAGSEAAALVADMRVAAAAKPPDLVPLRAACRRLPDLLAKIGAALGQVAKDK